MARATAAPQDVRVTAHGGGGGRAGGVPGSDLCESFPPVTSSKNATPGDGTCGSEAFLGSCLPDDWDGESHAKMISGDDGGGLEEDALKMEADTEGSSSRSSQKHENTTDELSFDVNPAAYSSEFVKAAEGAFPAVAGGASPFVPPSLDAERAAGDSRFSLSVQGSGASDPAAAVAVSAVGTLCDEPRDLLLSGAAMTSETARPDSTCTYSDVAAFPAAPQHSPPGGTGPGRLRASSGGSAKRLSAASGGRTDSPSSNSPSFTKTGAAGSGSQNTSSPSTSKLDANGSLLDADPNPSASAAYPAGCCRSPTGSAADGVRSRCAASPSRGNEEAIHGNSLCLASKRANSTGSAGPPSPVSGAHEKTSPGDANTPPSAPAKRGSSLASAANGVMGGAAAGRRDPRASPFPGVKFCSSRNAWIARWSENGQEKWKTFPVRDSTFEEARRCALEFRQGKDRKKYERLWQQLSADAEGAGGGGAPHKSPGPASAAAGGGASSPSSGGGGADGVACNLHGRLDGYRSPAVSFSPEGGSVRGTGGGGGGGTPSGVHTQDIFAKLSPQYTGGSASGADDTLENIRAAAAGLLFNDLQQHRWLEEALMGADTDGALQLSAPAKGALDAALRERMESRWSATANNGGRSAGANGRLVDPQSKKRPCGAAGLSSFSDFSGLLAGALEEAASAKKRTKLLRRDLLDGLVLNGLDADLDRQNVPPRVAGLFDGVTEEASADYLAADQTLNSLLGLGSLLQNGFPVASKREKRTTDAMGLDRWSHASRASFLGDSGATEDACRNLLNAKALGMYKDALVLILDDLLSHAISLMGGGGESGSLSGNGLAWRAKQKGAERSMRRVVEALRRRVADASVFRILSPFIKLFETCILEKKVPSQFDTRSQILYLNALSAMYEMAMPVGTASLGA
ncbi:AP2 domain transcription factor AP2VIII-7 [Besnoitia besnoiti]|uniref:AP2 domain transcription factor AP2VIII-7 n=1 Tax=Besnoitia besnoiti TaxID=94643 RepID=A0A2A9MC71_BESBE|nr:AP2 domain transcription factor AP2VIII-7 [Besnoitia besnoiti]PFH35575.1 AP2 domain transcription factor AP2VIII-7 [Besnoitia besnoiti]